MHAAVRGRVDQVNAHAFEPTLGLTADESIFYQTVGPALSPVGALPQVLRSTDAGDRWENVSPQLGTLQRHQSTSDPYLHVDLTTSRVFTLDYLLPTVECHQLSFADEVPEWTTTAVCGETDFQKLFTGPPAVSTLIGYPNVVYICAVNGGVEFQVGLGSVMTTCSKSLDGGVTFVPTGTPPFTDDPQQTDGVGLHGHCTGHANPGAVGPEGTVYLSRGGCGQPELAISHDEGATWQRVQVADNGIYRGAEFVVDPVLGWEFANPVGTTAVAADTEGNVYFAWVAADRLPYLAVSRDGGKTWGQPLMIAPPGVRETNLIDVDVREPGQVALSYMGSENSPGSPFPNEALECAIDDDSHNLCGGASFAEDPDEAYADVTWNGYITISHDLSAGEPEFLTAAVNDPSDPLVRGPCGPGDCPGAGDFFDVKLGPDGAPWAAFVDTCVEDDCQRELFGEGIVGRLVGLA